MASFRVLSTNNGRSRLGLRKFRKVSSHNKKRARNEMRETVEALFDYFRS